MVNKVKALLGTGPVALAIGLGVLGASSYTFLLVSGRVLGDERYAPLGTLWILVFLLAPAFFYPIEQEVTRAVAARRARGQGVRPVIERAGVLAVGLCGLLVALSLALSPLYLDELFNGQWVLVVALLVTFVTFGAEYLLKGLLAGSAHLRGYAAVIAIEGTVRAGAAVAFAIGGATSAQPFALAIGLACAVSVLVVFPRQKPLLTAGETASWRELSASLGNLIVASLLSQVLTNAAPIVVKYYAAASQQALAGAFVKAVVITRIPVFLFQAVQAVLLPRLTHHAAMGQRGEFDRTLNIALTIVLGIGILGCAGAAVLGDELLKLFGSDYPFDRSDVFYLALGNALLLLCLTMAQALVAVHAQWRTVMGWGVGVIAFFATYALPGNIVLRSEWALIIGAAAALIVLWISLKRQPFAAVSDEIVNTEIG